MNPLPDFVNHSLDVLFGPELKPNQRKVSDAVARPQPDTPTLAQAASSRFSLKAVLLWLGLLHQTNCDPGPKSPSPQLLVAGLEERVRTLESLLKAEKALCRAQREELGKLRSQAKRIDTLEADLATERESGKQLVQWLLEAEQELAKVHGFFNELSQDREGTDPVPCKPSSPLPLEPPFR
jgi:hypothetical protein